MYKLAWARPVILQILLSFDRIRNIRWAQVGHRFVCTTLTTCVPMRKHFAWSPSIIKCRLEASQGSSTSVLYRGSCTLWSGQTTKCLLHSMKCLDSLDRIYIRTFPNILYPTIVVSSSLPMSQIIFHGSWGELPRTQQIKGSRWPRLRFDSQVLVECNLDSTGFQFKYPGIYNRTRITNATRMVCTRSQISEEGICIKKAYCDRRKSEEGIRNDQSTSSCNGMRRVRRRGFCMWCRNEAKKIYT